MGNTVSNAVQLITGSHAPMTDEESEKAAKLLHDSMKDNPQLLAKILQSESNSFDASKYLKAGILQVDGTTDKAANIHPKVRQKVKDMFGL